MPMPVKHSNFSPKKPSISDTFTVFPSTLSSNEHHKFQYKNPLFLFITDPQRQTKTVETTATILHSTNITIKKQKKTWCSFMNIRVSSMFGFLLLLLPLFMQTSYCATVVVDGISQWKNPTVYVGDTVIFNHSDQYKLYIFRNEKAFNLCLLTEATLLSKPNSTSFTWHPSRLGFFYFTFINGSQKICQDSQKLPIKVSQTSPPPKNAIPEFPPNAAPGPASGGGFVPSTPTFPWPNLPREAAGPAQAPAATSPTAGAPFINSNPAVPLPTNEVDSATLRPLPTSGYGQQVMVGLNAAYNQKIIVFLVVIVLVL